jgi:hypothetical protein
MLSTPGLRALAVSMLAAACALIPARAFAQASFSAFTVYSSADQVQVLGHGDFNNDGREDYVVTERSATSGGGRTLLFLSNGDGTYDAPITLSSILVNAGQFVVGDFNHDGNLDYAVLDVANQGVDVYIGHGDGTFTFNDVLGTMYSPVGIAAADLNHDNNTDIIVAGDPGGYGNILVWMAQGNQYSSFTGGISITSGVIDPQYVTTGDFDGDGKPDLALVSKQNGATTVQVFYGDGAGNLGSPTQLTDPNGNWDQWDVNAIGDLENNGTSDLVMAQTQGGTTKLPGIAVFKGNTDRTLSFSTISTPNGCPSPQIAIADYNGDGFNDLVYGEGACSGTGTQNLVLNPASAAGVFSGSEQVIHASILAGPIMNVKSTQGTKPDIVLTENGQSSGQNVELLENTSTGSFPGCGTTTQATGLNVCAPTGSTATSPVKFSVSASGPTPMRTAAVWVDGQKVAEQLTHAFSNYSFLDQSLTLSAGTHDITIFGTGWDNTLQETTVFATVGTSNGCPAPTSPGVNVCNPVNASTVGSPTEVTATANITGTLARMEIWVNGAKMFTETTSTSFDTTLNLGAGYYQFDIYAVNTDGTLWETTVFATVGSSNGCAAPSSPGVNVCSPVNNSTVNSPVQATATAAITGTLARMEVWVDGVKMYTETTSTSLNTPITLPSGTHQFDFYAVNTQETKWEATVFATVP